MIRLLFGILHLQSITVAQRSELRRLTMAVNPASTQQQTQAQAAENNDLPATAMDYTQCTPPGYCQYPYPGKNVGTRFSDVPQLQKIEPNSSLEINGLKDFGENRYIPASRRGTPGRNIAWGMPYPGIGGEKRGTAAGLPTLEPAYGGPYTGCDGAYGGADDLLNAQENGN